MGEDVATAPDVRYHLVNALSAANAEAEQAGIARRTLARYEKERELLTSKLAPEPGESLLDAGTRALAEKKSAVEAQALAEELLRNAQRDMLDAENRLAGVVKERDVALAQEQEKSEKSAESWERERAGLAKAIGLKADECLLTAILRLQREVKGVSEMT